MCLPLVFASCGSKKALVKEPVIQSAPTQTAAKVTPQADNLKELAFVQKVSDNQVYSQNITGSMSFNIQAGGKNITVPGSLHMRKDQMIRIQLFIPILGTEVGRLDFTPNYVLILDRMHKQYVKADYNQVDFLQKQGINFYSLQALFWNQLLLPGTTKVSEGDLSKFKVVLKQNQPQTSVSYSKSGMTYLWKANSTSGRIEEANVTYSSKQYGNSALNLKYGEFKSVGVKMFPATQNLTLTTTANKQKQTVKVNIEMDEVKTKDNWDLNTKIPSSYKQVDPKDALGKIMNM